MRSKPINTHTLLARLLGGRRGASKFAIRTKDVSDGRTSEEGDIMTLNIRLLTLVMTIAFVLLMPHLARAQGFGPRAENTALNGQTLTYYPRASVDQCQADCANNGNCKGFTWIQAGTYNRGDAAMCYLISAVTGSTSAR